MEYSARIDWQINNNVKQELTKRWIDISKLRISTTKGVVEIKGAISFTGQAGGDTELSTIMNKLKNIDRAIRGINYVRDIHWKLDNWKKIGSRWVPSEIEEKQHG